MGINNLNNVHLTDQQVNAVNKALTDLDNALKILYVNLSVEDRIKYGSINEQNKLFVNKINDFATAQPDLRSPDVDWAEFAKDFKTRILCENVLTRLENISIGIRNRKILGDYDNLQDALTDYAFTNYKVGTKATGYEEKQRECKQFFAKNKKKTIEKQEKPSGEQGGKEVN